MTKPDQRKAIQALHEAGKKKKEIARLLNLDPKTIRKILSNPAWVAPNPRRDKKDIDVELLRKIHGRCDGYVQRIHEVLQEEHGIQVGYSTLSRMLREKEIGVEKTRRCHHVPDMPGMEMQHDTTPYRLKIGKETVTIICSGLYLRYSKMRYIKFYPCFNRFRMKGFIHEALTHWGYAGRICIIDNTNLAVLSGTGKRALFHPEMIAFAKPYGFEWQAHEKGHANRKAGKERNFWTVETNFLPGRDFESMEDINRQALDWACSRYAKRPLTKSRLIPMVLFEEEKPELAKLPGYVPPPCQPHQRIVDAYGYIAFQGNYYWVPGKGRGKVEVLEYPDRIAIYQARRLIAPYPLPDWKIKNKKFTPQGVDTNPYEPKNIKKPCLEEEKRLREAGKICRDYLDFIKSSGVRQKPRFIRQLYGLYKKTTKTLFLATLERALKYRVTGMESVERISRQLITRDIHELPDGPVNNDYEQREAYRQGRFSGKTGLKVYQDLLEDKDDE